MKARSHNDLLQPGYAGKYSGHVGYKEGTVMAGNTGSSAEVQTVSSQCHRSPVEGAWCRWKAAKVEEDALVKFATNCASVRYQDAVVA